jgi:hypothetical protein
LKEDEAVDPEDVSSRFLEKVGKLQPDYMVPHPTRQEFS